MRADIQNKLLPRGATVQIVGGTYLLRETLKFSAQDSGTPIAPIVYATPRGQRALFSGGQVVNNWKNVGGRWETVLPRRARRQMEFRSIVAQPKALESSALAQSRLQFHRTQRRAIAQNREQGHDRFGFKTGDVSADWHNLDDVDFLMMQVWTMARMKAQSIDTQKREVTFSGQTRTMESYGAFPKGNRYIAENVREALSPGEWYLDRKSGVLTYWPLTGETPQNSQFIAPRLESSVEFQGTNQQPISDITLRGLSFEHSNWTTPAVGNANIQAEVDVAAAIQATSAQRIKLENCDITHIGHYAVSFGRACHDNQLLNCRMEDLGAGGVKIGETAFSDDLQVLADKIQVQNCLIAHFGRLHPAAVGVWIGHSPNNIIDHNTIIDGYYTGISPGWSWGYGNSATHHNTITNNRIAQIGQGVLSDMGGIYTLGVSPGTVLRGNVIHDVSSFDYGGWGIYFDEGTTGIVAENNVVYRTKSAGFHQHYGRDNLVKNNIFIEGHEAQLMRSREEDHLSFKIQNNIITFNDRPLLGSNWKGTRDNFQLDSNLYWNKGAEPLSFAGKTLAQWQDSGQDKTSIVADPLFVDAAHDNYNLRPNSPALKIGFVPFDWSNAGAHDANGKLLTLNSVPQMARAFPAPPPPQPYVENFESGEIGAKASFVTNEENKTATARLSIEQFSPFETSHQSLKFTDEAGQKQSYNPHVYAAPKLGGALIGQFDIRPDQNAQISHEWRDNKNPYHTGPALYIQPDGALQANGKTLMTLNTKTWYRCEIRYTTGTDKWSLQVLAPDGTRQNFDNLTCDANLKSLDWWGFVSNGTVPATWYLDNARVGMP